MKEKIVVLGSLGMAGHMMAGHLSSTGVYNVLGVAKQPGRYVDKILDVTDFEALKNYLEAEQPEYVINCIGALIGHSTKNVAAAILLNSYLPHFLAQIGNKLNYKLIQISTDCVFSGREGPYAEDSFRDGDNSYARSKSLGEIINCKDLTIRTSIVGPELKPNGTGLLDWFLKETGDIKGYTQVFWSGVTTLELAKATHEMIQQDICGLYHLCPKHKISKYEMLQLFANAWHQKNSIIGFDDYVVDKSLICSRRDFDYSLPCYGLMVKEMWMWMDSHKSYYPHYDL